MRDDRQYLCDIAEAAELITEHTRSTTLESFLNDKMLQQAVLFNFTIIGEAANKLSKAAKLQYPEIDWSSMIGFRNIIVHAYFSLNLKTVWMAATRKASTLAEQVRSIIRYDFSGDE
jgi:uncharacterized protein with HEPN domain